MSREIPTSECRIEDIAAYIDGELCNAFEMELEAHFATCSGCRTELNEQKRFLRELDAGFTAERELELPADFAKTIIANAESTVTGLRRPRELYNAAFICAALTLFLLFALGSDASLLLARTAGIAEQGITVAGFFGHLIYSLFLGIVIVLRTIGSQAVRDPLLTVLLLGIAFLSLTAVSKRIVSAGRV